MDSPFPGFSGPVARWPHGEPNAPGGPGPEYIIAATFNGQSLASLQLQSASVFQRLIG